LSDYGQVEAPSNAAELLADAGIARAHLLRVGDDSGAPARRSEVVDCCARRRLILALLGLDHFGRNPAGVRNRNHRIVEESYSGEMGVECRSN